MTRKPDGAEALLGGFAEWLAHELLKHAARHEMKPEPETDIAAERCVRLLGVMARTALAIHRLEEREDIRRETGNSEEANMDDQPDNTDAIERKYRQIHERLAEYAARIAARSTQGEDSAGIAGPGVGELALESQPGAA